MPISNRAKAYLRSHIRLAWRYYDEARKEVMKLKKCAICGKAGSKSDPIYADHIKPVGTFVPEDQPYIKRMFCDRNNLQPAHKSCNAKKGDKE